MKTLMIPVALMALLGSAAIASAETARVYTPIDCMQRDGGPTGCSRGQQSNATYYLSTGRSVAQDQSPRSIQPNEYDYYAPREFGVQSR